MPHSYTVDNFEIINDKKDILTRLFNPSFNPYKSVILEKNPSGIKHFTMDKNYEKANITTYKENSVEIKLSLERNKILVLTDNYYSGWKAYVDNEPVEIYRANYTFRAIVVPSGMHIVKFSYEPYLIKIGIALSLISILLYLIFYIIYRNRTND